MNSLKRDSLIAAAALVVVAGLAGISLLLHSLFSGYGQMTAAWSPAIQSTSAIALALATIVLVFVTARYVRLTRTLVSLQGDFITPERERKREETVHQLATLLADGVLMLVGVITSYPFKDASTLDASRVTAINEINELSTSLLRLSASLPAPLIPLCRKACDACGFAYLAQSALYETLRRTQMSMVSTMGDRIPYDWNDAKGTYLKLVERGEAWEIDWRDLREGKLVFEASDATGTLYDAVIEYLAADPPKQTM